MAWLYLSPALASHKVCSMCYHGCHTRCMSFLLPSLSNILQTATQQTNVTGNVTLQIRLHSPSSVNQQKGLLDSVIE